MYISNITHVNITNYLEISSTRRLFSKHERLRVVWLVLKTWCPMFRCKLLAVNSSTERIEPNNL